MAPPMLYMHLLPPRDKQVDCSWRPVPPIPRWSAPTKGQRHIKETRSQIFVQCHATDFFMGRLSEHGTRKRRALGTLFCIKRSLQKEFDDLSKFGKYTATASIFMLDRNRKAAMRVDIYHFPSTSDLLPLHGKPPWKGSASDSKKWLNDLRSWP